MGGFPDMTGPRKDSSVKASKLSRLEKAGWRVGTATDLLDLRPDEAAYVEIKVRLARELLDRRHSLGLSQSGVADRIRSSQSRVARMEAADPSVSLDLMVRSLLALGVTPAPIRDIAPRLADQREPHYGRERSVRRRRTGHA